MRQILLCACVAIGLTNCTRAKPARDGSVATDGGHCTAAACSCADGGSGISGTCTCSDSGAGTCACIDSSAGTCSCNASSAGTCSCNTGSAGTCSCNAGACSCTSGTCACIDGACSCTAGACSCSAGACSCSNGTCSCSNGTCSCSNVACSCSNGTCSCSNGTCTLGDGGVTPVDAGNGCPAGMARVTLSGADGSSADAGAGAVCVDRYEAATEVVDATGAATPHPYDQPVDGVAKGSTIIAVVADGVKPQGYISEAQAAAACAAADKRLCTLTEWLAACQGPQGWTYPYGNTYEAGACNEGRATNPVNDCFGPGDTVFTSTNMNASCCDDQPNTIAPGGSFTRCVSSWGIYDLHGNLHEWIDATTSAGNGIFKGGFFVDAKINGPGCLYATTAHAKTYHDYSTGFRCCADPAH